MFRTNARGLALTIIAVSLIPLLITGCAKKPMWGDPEKGLILTYRMPEAGGLTYRLTNRFSQTLDVMGQSMKIMGEERQQFTLASKGGKTDNLMLTVTMDSMSVGAAMPQGELNADVSGVLGKSFEMVVSPLGRELEVIGAEEIKYSMGSEGDRSIEPSFNAVLPDLPSKPVTIGDSWTATDSILEKSDDGEMLIVINNNHTLIGYETMHEMECAKITNTFTGTLSGTGMEQGMELSTEGAIEGTETWYFAYKKGYFVESTAEGSAEGTIKGVNNPAINIPMTREYKMVGKLVKTK
jgi:hypothetical protein